jgi:hypothetical protein
MWERRISVLTLFKDQLGSSAKEKVEEGAEEENA